MKDYLLDIRTGLSYTGGQSSSLYVLCGYINHKGIQYDPRCGLVGVHIAPYNVKVSDIDAAGMKDGNMVIALNDGSSLTIQNYDRQGATTFQLSDGTYTYNKSTGTWS